MTENALVEEANRERTRARRFRATATVFWALSALLAVVGAILVISSGFTEGWSTLISAAAWVFLALTMRGMAKQAENMASYWNALDAMADLIDGRRDRA